MPQSRPSTTQCIAFGAALVYESLMHDHRDIIDRWPSMRAPEHPFPALGSGHRSRQRARHSWRYLEIAGEHVPLAPYPKG
jgi:hypothetical protein